MPFRTSLIHTHAYKHFSMLFQPLLNKHHKCYVREMLLWKVDLLTYKEMSSH